MTAYKIASVAVCYNFIRRDLSRMPLSLTVIMKLLTYLLYVTEGLFSHRQSLKLRRGALLQMMPDATHCVASINLLQFQMIESATRFLCHSWALLLLAVVNNNTEWYACITCDLPILNKTVSYKSRIIRSTQSAITCRVVHGLAFGQNLLLR